MLREEDIAYLQSCDEGSTGYFGRMLSYLDNFILRGVSEGRFTELEAREDLEIALWYAYACNNMDTYEQYYKAAQWMPDSEKNAKGCGTWYYRYACALMYCGRLEESLEYAEKGVQEEPDYPWGWLQLGKLRCHFGNKAGAQEAVERGLALEPGDFEFLTLRREIEEGRTLAEMEYHYIYPEHDQQLQDNLLSEADDKQKSIAGILCNQATLETIKALFQPTEWEADCPYCKFNFALGDYQVEGVFRMNEAALSKMNVTWLQQRREALLADSRFIHLEKKDGVYDLMVIIFNLDYSMELVYYDAQNNRSFTMEFENDEPFIVSSHVCR